MKLYTKQDLVVSSFSSVLIVLLAALGFWLYTVKPPVNPQDQAKNTTGAAEAVQEEDLIDFKTSPASQFLVDTFSQYTVDEQQNISVYEKLNEAVVNINTQVMTYSWFSQPYPTEGSAGSGSIIDTRGYVVTNRHVIEGAFKIYVSLSDGTQYEGTVVGSDDQTDIAVVKFSPPAGMQLKTISFADSSNLKVGQKVIAIGNPFGFDRTMTTGIISSLGRPIQIDKNAIVKDMIQTDTAINPGNSGGPLLDSQGRMIGINTMIYSTSGSSAGVGFAVPVNTAKRIVSDLIQYGFVNRGSIDAVFVELNSTLANYAGLSINQGLLVSEITKNGNADKAGIKAGSEAVRYNRLSPVFYIGGDVITAVNGSKIHSLLDLNSILENSKPNEKVQVTIQRGRQSLTIPVTLAQKGK
ncbi:MAG TPA: trypsin-like peptidase domain-containing protein [Treponemataceae bacterium]|nr:trypsin-like peptidase domain-containing protein [Treponemataceae bacterium]